MASFALLSMQTTVHLEASVTTQPTAFVGMAPMSTCVLDGLSLLTLAPHSFSLLLPLEERERPETSSRTRQACFHQSLNLLALLPGAAFFSITSHLPGVGFLILISAPGHCKV